MEVIDSKFSLERQGRAKRLSAELEAAMEKHKSSLENVVFQIGNYPTYDPSPEEIDILKTMAADWRGERGEKVKALLSSARELEGKLDGKAK